MKTLTQILRRETRVIFSLRAQPLWFRITKWTVAIFLTTRYHAQPWFWPSAGALVAVAFAVHFFYRWQTHGWTRPWGGWNDLAAGRD